MFSVQRLNFYVDIPETFLILDELLVFAYLLLRL
jgi:hypothetical protein